MAESKKSRIKKTKIRLLKDKIDKRHERVIKAGLERHHIRASVSERICPICKKTETIIQQLEVISRTAAGEERITSRIAGLGMYQFHYDIPIVKNVYQEFGMICVTCLEKDFEKRNEE